MSVSLGSLWPRLRRAERGAVTFVYAVAAVLGGFAVTVGVEGGAPLWQGPTTTRAAAQHMVTQRDDTPARVLLVPRRMVLAGETVISNTLRLSGITVPVGVAVDGATGAQLDAGQGWTSAPQVIARGEPLQLRVIAPPPGRSVTVTLTTGTLASIWTVSSAAGAAHTHQVLYGPWGACSAAAPCSGLGTQRREILCLRSDGRFVAVAECGPGLAATEDRACPSPAGDAACLAPPAGSDGWTQYCAAGSTARAICTGSDCAERFSFDGTSCVQSVFSACAADSARDLGGGWSHPGLPHGGVGVTATRAARADALPAQATAATQSAPVACRDGEASLGTIVTTATACVVSHKLAGGLCVPKAACAANSAAGGWSHAALDHDALGVAADRETPPGQRPANATAARDTATVTCDDGTATAGSISTVATACAAGWVVQGAGCAAQTIALTSVTQGSITWRQWADGQLPTSCRGYVQGSDHLAGSGDDPLRLGVPGTSAADSGLYRIDPTGGSSSDAVVVACEMQTQGGGWTRCLRQSLSSGANRTHSGLDATSSTVYTPLPPMGVVQAGCNSTATRDYLFTGVRAGTTCRRIQMTLPGNSFTPSAGKICNASAPNAYDHHQGQNLNVVLTMNTIGGSGCANSSGSSTNSLWIESPGAPDRYIEYSFHNSDHYRRICSTDNNESTPRTFEIYYR